MIARKVRTFMRNCNSAIALTWLFTMSFCPLGGKAETLLPPFDSGVNPFGPPSLPPHASAAASKQEDVGLTLPPSVPSPAVASPTPAQTFGQPSPTSHPEPPFFPNPPDTLPRPAPPRSQSTTAPLLSTFPASPIASLLQPPLDPFEQPPVPPPSPPPPPPPQTPDPPPETLQVPSWCVHEGMGGPCSVDLGVLTSFPGGLSTDTRR